MKKLKTLIIEDNVADQRRYVSFLETKENSIFDFTFAATLDQAEDVFKTMPYDLVILDYLLPDGSGLEFLKNHAEKIKHEATPIIMATSIGDEGVAVESIKWGAVDYIVKGKIDSETFKIAVDTAIRNFALRNQLRLKNEELSDFKEMTEHSSDFVFVLSGDLTFLDANPSLCTALSYAKAELVGMNLSAISPQFTKGLEEFIANIKKNGSCKIESDFKKKDGTIFPVYLNFSFSNTSQGMKLIGIGYDLTERKKMDQMLRLEKERALEHAEFKTQFLARMSHDIRTPLNSIIGMTEVLNEGHLDEDQRRYLSTISVAGQSLLDLVNDILDITKIEAGQVSLEEHEFDLEGIFVDAVDVISIQARRRNTEVIIEHIPQLDTLVVGDPLRLRQIVMNLLGNAVKFTEGGQITISAYSLDNSTLRVNVKDTGIGIPKNKLHEIFEAYKQAGADTTRKYGGTGLGLSICKKLVEIMHGQIWAESEVGKGSTFIFEVPLRLGRAKANSTMAKETLIDKKVFILAKSVPEAKYIAKMVAFLGGKAEISSNPEEAQSSIKNKNYDLNIIDCRLESQSGFQFIESLEKIKPVSKNTILLLPAGGHSKADIKQAERQDIGAVLIKPLKMDYFLSGVRKALGIESTVTESDTEFTLPKMRILIADDIDTNRTLLEAYLKKTSCEIDFAQDGLQAYQMAQAKTYDAVFMDMYMPEMSGEESTAKIRSYEQSKGLDAVPIVALTANAFDESAKKMIHAGCNDFLTKPIRKKVLIEKLMEISKHSLPKAAQGDDKNEPFSDAGINPQALKDLRYVDEHGEFLAKMIKSYLTHSEAIMNQLKKAVGRRHFHTVAELANELNEMSGTMGADKLAYSCWGMQVAAEKGEIDVFAHFFKIIEDDYAKARVFFSSELDRLYGEPG